MPEITRFGGYTYDNRHPSEQLHTFRHETAALRAEVKRLREDNRHLRMLLVMAESEQPR